MALPAGRYGVTKNQLLKIKKLPMNTIKLIEELTEKFDLLGTAAFKNSTSVVTESSDLVESGAVKKAIVGTVGWIGGKNKYNFDIGDVGANIITTANISYSDGVLSCQSTGAVSSGMYLKPTSLKSKFADLANIPCIFSCKAKSSVACNGAILTDTIIAMPTEWTEFTFEVSDPSNIGALVFYNKDASKTPIIYVKDMMLEVGSTATPYEPYHASVEETKADNSVIGTVEDGTNPTKSYAVGEHFIRNGKFCTVTVAVTTSSTWTLGSNYVEGDVAEWLNLSNLHISLSTATNNREIIEQLFTNIIPLLKNDLDSCYGVVKQGGVNTLGFNCFRNTSTTFYAFLYSNDRIFNALYNNGTVTIYQNVGTILN